MHVTDIKEPVKESIKERVLLDFLGKRSAYAWNYMS